jgi:hypothetical protein
MAYDPLYPTIGMTVFKPNNWKQFYGNAKAAIPSNVPEPRGKDIDLRMYIDSDHAGEKWMCWLHSGFFCFYEHCVDSVVLEAAGHNQDFSF